MIRRVKTIGALSALAERLALKSGARVLSVVLADPAAGERALLTARAVGGGRPFRPGFSGLAMGGCMRF